LPVAEKLFAEIDDTPMAFLSLGEENLAQMIRKVGFYHAKARNILNVCRTLLDEFNGHVPRKLDLLLKLPGVGRKTANIVLEHCFDMPTIAVDIHVHRITNRLGWVRTETVEDTEQALMKLIPKAKWHLVNHVFVRHGQTLCKPIGPRCGECPVLARCDFGRKRMGAK
jgi:endonuclease-3